MNILFSCKIKIFVIFIYKFTFICKSDLSDVTHNFLFSHKINSFKNCIYVIFIYKNTYIIM